MSLSELSAADLTNVPVTDPATPILILENSSEEPITLPDASAPGVKWAFWRVFGSTFITIFLAELGDKTQVATLLMSAESHNPAVVFAGAASALIATSLVGVLIGRWFGQYLSARTLEKATGMILLFVAAWLVWDLSHL